MTNTAANILPTGWKDFTASLFLGPLFLSLFISLTLVAFRIADGNLIVWCVGGSLIYSLLAVPLYVLGDWYLAPQGFGPFLRVYIGGLAYAVFFIFLMHDNGRNLGPGPILFFPSEILTVPIALTWIPLTLSAQICYHLILKIREREAN